MHRTRPHLPTLLLSLTLLSSCPLAHAQDPASPEAPPDSGEPVSEPAPAVSTPAPEAPEAAEAADDADDAQYATAKKYFERGVRFCEAGNYDAALTEFERAYAHMQGHPKRFFVLDNIGQCHERKFRYDRALEYYRRYLKEGGDAAEDRAAVLATITTLEGLLATLTIQSNVPAEVWVDDRLMGNAPGDVLVPGGLHVIELRAAGYEASKREVNIAARERQNHAFTLNELSQYEGLSPVYFYGGVALSAASLAAGSYFGLKALSEDKAGHEREEEHGEFGNDAEDEERVKRLALTADICFASAAVFGVGTTLLYFMTDWGDSTDERPPEATRVEGHVGPDALGVSIRGSF